MPTYIHVKKLFIKTSLDSRMSSKGHQYSLLIIDTCTLFMNSSVNVQTQQTNTQTRNLTMTGKR